MKFPFTSITPLTWLGLMRIMLGLMFLTTWASNLTKGYYAPDGLQIFFTEVFRSMCLPAAWACWVFCPTTLASVSIWA